MLPNFVGIGVPRGGSTWLHELLRCHPDCYVSHKRKELHYFDDEFHRGLEWYKAWFPPDQEADRYPVVGEVTPQYLYSAEAARRVRDFPSIRRLVVILRNPVGRTFSHYEWEVRMFNERRPLREWVEARPHLEERSLYSRFLPAWLDLFTRDELLVLIFERVFADIPAAREAVARHLGLDPARFPPAAGEERVNEGGVPRAGPVYRLAVQTAKHLRRVGFDGLVRTLGHRVGLKKLAESPGFERLTLSADDRAWLEARYADEVTRVERILGEPIPEWRPRS